MPIVDINLNEVKEKPPLPLNQPMTFGFKGLPSLQQSKDPNKHSGVREWNVNCQLIPLDPQWAGSGFDYTVWHNWSMAKGATESSDPTFSIKKFFSVVNFPWHPDGKFSTEEMAAIRFVATLKSGRQGRENFPQLDKILGPAQ